MNLIQTLIMSAVEGITEFLPISSTGHLILTAQALGIQQTEFVKSFEIIIQLGAILAIVVLYLKTLLNRKIWPQILIAFVPSAIIGFTLYKFIKGVLIGNSMVVVIALLIGEFFLIKLVLGLVQGVIIIPVIHPRLGGLAFLVRVEAFWGFLTILFHIK